MHREWDLGTNVCGRQAAAFKVKGKSENSMDVLSECVLAGCLGREGGECCTSACTRVCTCV